MIVLKFFHEKKFSDDLEMQPWFLKVEMRVVSVRQLRSRRSIEGQQWT
jgi:hypothetical protein